MSDLALGLLVLGAIAVAGVLVYNRWQEYAVRRTAQRAFAPPATDALLGDAPLPRREPTLGRTPQDPGSLPDAKVDYTIELRLAMPEGAGSVLERWAPIEQRFARRVLLAGSDGDGWRRLAHGDAAPCVALLAGLQMVSRAGVVSDAELVEFRSEVETLGAAFKAQIAAPEMRQALEAAHQLDRTCAEADIQVALHVIGAGALEADLGEQPFQVVRREDGLTLTLDVGRTPELARAYEAMARTGRQLASTHGARLVDDRGADLDERALAAIGAQLEAVRQLLAGRGVETGSALALRLFS